MHFDVKKSAASGKGAALSGGLDLQPSGYETSIPVKQLTQPGFSFPRLLSILISWTTLSLRFVVTCTPCCRLRWRVLVVRVSFGLPARSLNQLVQFPAIQPDTTAFRAIVYLDSLTFRHPELFFADRTQHFKLTPQASAMCKRHHPTCRFFSPKYWQTDNIEHPDIYGEKHLFFRYWI